MNTQPLLTDSFSQIDLEIPEERLVEMVAAARSIDKDLDGNLVFIYPNGRVYTLLQDDDDGFLFFRYQRPLGTC